MGTKFRFPSPQEKPLTMIHGCHNDTIAVYKLLRSRNRWIPGTCCQKIQSEQWTTSLVRVLVSKAKVEGDRGRHLWGHLCPLDTYMQVWKLDIHTTSIHTQKGSYKLDNNSRLKNNPYLFWCENTLANKVGFVLNNLFGGRGEGPFIQNEGSAELWYSYDLPSTMLVGVTLLFMTFWRLKSNF